MTLVVTMAINFISGEMTGCLMEVTPHSHSVLCLNSSNCQAAVDKYGFRRVSLLRLVCKKLGIQEGCSWFCRGKWSLCRFPVSSP